MKGKNAFCYSIVIPHYNSSETLKRLLKSIPERDDIQIVVIDDFSTSDEKNVLKTIQHKNLEIFYNPSKTNAGATRNQGLKIATGKWILFADADDFYNAKTFDILDQFKDDELDYLCFCANSFDNEKNMYGGRKITSDYSVRCFLKRKSELSINMLKYKNFACWNKMYNKLYLEKNNIVFESSIVNNDVWFSFQVALHATSFKVISDELYCCTYSPNSLTYQKRSIEREFEFYKMSKKRNGFYKSLSLGKGFIRYDFIYLPYIIKKRGLVSAVKFYHYVWTHKEDLYMAEKEYVGYLKRINGDGV